jgi:hypothetical protein
LTIVRCTTFNQTASCERLPEIKFRKGTNRETDRSGEAFLMASISSAQWDKSAAQRELQQLRHQSLIATRTGDFRKVAQLTLEVARLNRFLLESTATTDRDR